MTKNISFAKLSKQLAGYTTELDRFISSMEDIASRGLKIIRQKKHSAVCGDASFDSDFNKLLEKIKKFVGRFEEFYVTASNIQRKLKEKGCNDESTIILKTFVTKARELNLTVEELESVFNYVKSSIKKENLKFNWWQLEVAVSDIVRLSGKVLFVSREISKFAENSYPAEDGRYCL